MRQVPHLLSTNESMHNLPSSPDFRNHIHCSAVLLIIITIFISVSFIRCRPMSHRPTDTRYHQPVSKVETIYYYCCCCCCLPSTTTTTSASTRTTTVDYGGTQNTLLEPRAPFLHSSHPRRDWSPDKRRHLRPPPKIRPSNNCWRPP